MSDEHSSYHCDMRQNDHRLFQNAIEFYLRIDLFALATCFYSPGMASDGSVAHDVPNLLVT